MLTKKFTQRHWAILITFILSLIVMPLANGIPAYHSIHAQQEATRVLKSNQDKFRNLAHKPYKAHVPGELCGTNHTYWQHGSKNNSYKCREDGLQLTRIDTHHITGEWFSFLPYELSTNEKYSSLNYFPHSYRIQVKATFLNNKDFTCAGVHMRAQNFYNFHSFDICNDRYWYYQRTDPKSKQIRTVYSAMLPKKSKSSYTISIDVQDKSYSLSLDGQYITTVYDSTLNSTQQIQLVLWGSQTPKKPISVLFSDFSYTPLP